MVMGQCFAVQHIMDDSIPVLGVNFDPTHVEEVCSMLG